MKAQLKCSNCGAEISNLNMSWGQKQWMWIVPFFILMIFFPFATDYFLKGDKHNFRSDLVLKDTERRLTNGNIEILGSIENHGVVDWQNIVIKADLFDKEGKFIDQVSSRLN
jgi:regulatory protein YycI of two-component signal transduction system YycFG